MGRQTLLFASTWDKEAAQRGQKREAHKLDKFRSKIRQL
jgi:hypothetical protein